MDISEEIQAQRRIAMRISCLLQLWVDRSIPAPSGSSAHWEHAPHTTPENRHGHEGVWLHHFVESEASDRGIA